MKEDNNIEKKIKLLLNDYLEEVPANMWNDIEKDIAPKSIPLWRRYSAIAAVALLCIVSSVLIYFTCRTSDSYINQVNVSKDISELKIEKPHELKPLEAILDTLNGGSKRFLAVNVSHETEYNKEQNERNDNDIISDAIVKEKEQPSEKSENVKEKSKNKKSYKEYCDDYNAVSIKRTKRAWSIGISGNTLSDYNSSANGYMHLRNVSYSSNMMCDASNDYLMMDQNRQFYSAITQQKATSNIKHHRPVTFGLSLRFDLKNDWIIDTGIDYTYISSELKSGTTQNFYIEEQKLHYIGIPVRLGHEIWGNKFVLFYALAGGEVEKCVHGKLETTFDENNKESDSSEKINIKNLQLSAMVTLGAQCRLNNKLSIYAEPGIRYYVNDGSEIQTIRKEHPLAFNLQFGLRFTFPR